MECSVEVSCEKGMQSFSLKTVRNTCGVLCQAVIKIYVFMYICVYLSSISLCILIIYIYIYIHPSFKKADGEAI